VPRFERIRASTLSGKLITSRATCSFIILFDGRNFHRQSLRPMLLGRR
jgi:hypothetical protein